MIKEDACIKFCDEMKLLYLETDASGVELGACLPLQTREGMSCPREGTRQQYPKASHIHK